MLQSRQTTRAGESFAFRTRAVDALPIQARVERARRLPAPRHAPLPLVSLMATRLVEHEIGSGACTDADLVRDGFTAAEIRRHGDGARDLAAGRIVQRLLDDAA